VPRQLHARRLNNHAEECVLEGMHPAIIS
jgi:hypothetical protein